MRMHIGVKRVVVRLSKVGAALRDKLRWIPYTRLRCGRVHIWGYARRQPTKHATQVGSDEYAVRVYNTLERSVTKHSSLTRLRRRDEPRA